ncbi:MULTISPECIES: type II toxin-antitoxin system Phd/YefM family antitoxin [unclassified Cryobacterium]|uniref:type II toxin-antitoxin system Phd/YefM family antitoxin n=1 Tax=unclassified Cryobacterium TaxID=2649013 RepID=UPI00106A3DA7|nr:MULTISPECIES: type II toxin-antitoxin system Phd/YefM family antitoxin [unclassified Cryobacterium]TFD03662.1 type II toxin-antitoxin system Phd/YefM family antitoxin [Cryobacterium sp. TMT1-66-1]TFD12968.1 type II toxin-antitoxin system Phd/YefM family antitoxin [Cryobacterium sp. TMT1-2-2]
MMKEVPVTQARADLSNLVNEVVYGHERITLTRHGKALAVLVSPEEAKLLDSIMSSSPDMNHAVQIVDTSGSRDNLGLAARYVEPNIESDQL